ncbi:hypothetical protein H6P81_002947 [Aristolochia fimbriata]|uniref:BAH domain-containing protein n=1 Tax=Aristolochia fimbriata TaxID=158543 RepID=A0AAV7FCZ9_ARIFI|nr:hypothetical protein H6P81_002947 [Aristolochia fimbriata]
MVVAMDPKVFVRWEEVFVSNDKGNRVVHYYLDRADGGSELAVVGRERSLRHMTYTVPNHFFRSMRPASCLRWRSRREVVDWLSSLVTGSVSCGSSPQVDRFSDEEEPCSVDAPSSKSFVARKSGQPSKDFLWIGSPWTCRKRRNHYQSFCRNGITITVHDFVYVLTEGCKRLVAYLEDMYEDVRGNNMVVVRWFHKIDEVGIVLPPKFNDREIFFSLCLQDLSVECIDGLATVLCPQHFQRFLNEATSGHWDPYMCHRQFDNDDITPFDVTLLQGYWNQEFLKYIYSTSASAGNSRKRRRKQETLISQCNGAAKTFVNTSSPYSLSEKDVGKKIDSLPQLSIGSQVEVLCQDSGIRGCWFEAMIIKKHKGKVKVRYQDLQDADDMGNLEEWLLASRMVPLDRLGHRQGERAILRPCPPKEGKSAVPLEGFNVGSAVEVRWHQGWWEGFVAQKLSEAKYSVYFPGEGQTATFSSSELRVAKEWVCNRWNPINPKADVVSLVLTSGGDKKATEAMDVRPSGSGSSPGRGVDHPWAEETHCSSLGDDTPDHSKSPADRRQGERFVNLKWSVSKKRKRSSCSKNNLSRHRRRSSSLNSGSSSEDAADGSGGCDGFVVPTSLKVDREVCKLGSDPLFMSTMPVSNLVLSR